MIILKFTFFVYFSILMYRELMYLLNFVLLNYPSAANASATV